MSFSSLDKVLRGLAGLNVGSYLLLGDARQDSGKVANVSVHIDGTKMRVTGPDNKPKEFLVNDWRSSIDAADYVESFFSPKLADITPSLKDPYFKEPDEV